VSDNVPTPELYQVTYSIRVKEQFLKLADLARERGDAEDFVAALREFHRRLGLYPQFGKPLLNLKNEPGQVWIGIVRPLAMRYSVIDERRLVFVATLPVLLPLSNE
jgi:hypothetical protein